MFTADDAVLYDSPDPYTREEITREALTELPMLHDNEEERRIFNAAGFVVPRRVPRFTPETVPFGGLVDFTRIHEMYAPANDDDDGDVAQSTAFSVYPQAGLLTCGHVTAKGLMYPFHKFIEHLNQSLKQSPEDDNNPNDDWITNDRPGVFGLASQMYNAMMHNTRGNSTQHHGVVLGNVTAALASYWTEKTPYGGKAQKFVRQCDKKLPHDEYIHKIRDRPISRDLRVENVIAITMSAIHPAKRTGRYCHFMSAKSEHLYDFQVPF